MKLIRIMITLLKMTMAKNRDNNNNGNATEQWGIMKSQNPKKIHSAAQTYKNRKMSIQIYVHRERERERDRGREREKGGEEEEERHEQGCHVFCHPQEAEGVSAAHASRPTALDAPFQSSEAEAPSFWKTGRWAM